MGNLYPMQPLGDAESSKDILSYADRNPIGIEDEASAPTDYSGWNEGAAWTRRFEDAFEDEHDGYGLHDTLKVAKATVSVTYNWSTSEYVLLSAYMQDTSGNEYFHDDAVTNLDDTSGAGHLEVTFATDLPSANMRVTSHPTQFWEDGTGSSTPVYHYVHVYWDSSSAANKVHVQRYQDGTLTHGKMSFEVHVY
jgi:hypothetical protein